MRRIKAVVTGVGLISLLLVGCATDPGGQAKSIPLPNCSVSSSGQVFCTTGGMRIPLP